MILLISYIVGCCVTYFTLCRIEALNLEDYHTSTYSKFILCGLSWFSIVVFVLWLGFKDED